jgi:hypothetical protein
MCPTSRAYAGPGGPHRSNTVTELQEVAGELGAAPRCEVWCVFIGPERRWRTAERGRPAEGSQWQQGLGPDSAHTMNHTMATSNHSMPGPPARAGEPRTLRSRLSPALHWHRLRLGCPSSVLPLSPGRTIPSPGGAGAQANVTRWMESPGSARRVNDVQVVAGESESVTVRVYSAGRAGRQLI